MIPRLQTVDSCCLYFERRLCQVIINLFISFLLSPILMSSLLHRRFAVVALASSNCFVVMLLPLALFVAISFSFLLAAVDCFIMFRFTDAFTVFCFELFHCCLLSNFLLFCFVRFALMLSQCLMLASAFTADAFTVVSAFCCCCCLPY